MFAVLGVNLYTYVAPGDALSDQRNFHTLGSSMLLLFQCLTGDNWSGMMADTTVSERSGLCSNAEGNCGSQSAIAYFIAFQLIGSFVFLNLVVAVILENFSSLGNVRTDLVSAADLDGFKEAWCEFDPDGDSKIPASDLPDLVLSIPPPMGLKGTPSIKRHAIKMCLKLKVRGPSGQLMSLRQERGEVFFADVIDALVNRNMNDAEISFDPSEVEVPTVELQGSKDANPHDDEPDDVQPSPRTLDFANEPGRAGNPNYMLTKEFKEQLAHDVDKIFALQLLAMHRDKFQRWRARASARAAAKKAEAFPLPANDNIIKIQPYVAQSTIDEFKAARTNGTAPPVVQSAKERARKALEAKPSVPMEASNANVKVGLPARSSSPRPGRKEANRQQAREAYTSRSPAGAGAPAYGKMGGDQFHSRKAQLQQEARLLQRPICRTEVMPHVGTADCRAAGTVGRDDDPGASSGCVLTLRSTTKAAREPRTPQCGRVQRDGCKQRGAAARRGATNLVWKRMGRRWRREGLHAAVGTSRRPESRCGRAVASRGVPCDARAALVSRRL